MSTDTTATDDTMANEIEQARDVIAGRWAETRASLVPPETQAKLDNWFSYHPPEGNQAERYTAIRAAAKAFAEVVAVICPDSADRTVALRHIRDAVFSANASIACKGK